jgi:hypothetical protein
MRVRNKMSELRTCKICKKEITDKDVEDVIHKDRGDKNIEAVHWNCFVLHRLDKVVGIP